jgi:hypothetical protein
VRVLDLFAGMEGPDGLHGWSRAFAERGHQVTTVDIEPSFRPTVLGDVMRLEPRDLGRFDVAVISPPCERFSVAAISKNWVYHPETDSLTPRRPEAERACDLVKRAIWLAWECGARLWWLENPRAALRKMDFMRQYRRTTLSWCRYGLTMMKPTDIWGVWGSWAGRGCCRNGDPCHIAAPRGSKVPGTTQGIKGSANRAVIPPQLSLEVCLSAEADLNQRLMPAPVLEAGRGTLEAFFA